MSGHSKWATIRRKKGAADAARGKVFNRLIREISIAARLGGGDPAANPRLRTAVNNARGQNMPNKNIENAIMKGTGQLEGVSYEEVTFEGYGPSGVAILIETMTDNRKRTVAEVRHVLTKAGGNLGATNSVNWMFNTRGIVTVPRDAIGEDDLLEIVLEAGAEDVRSEDDMHEVTTSLETFDDVRGALESKGITPESAELTKVPENTVKLEGDTAQKVLKLIDTLDDLDDTQHVYANFDISDEEAERYGNQ